MNPLEGRVRKFSDDVGDSGSFPMLSLYYEPMSRSALLPRVVPLLLP